MNTAFSSACPDSSYLCASGQRHICFCSIFLSASKAIALNFLLDDRSVWSWLFFKGFLDLKPIQKGPAICFIYSSDLWLRKLKNSFSIPAVVFSQYCAIAEAYTDTFILEVWVRRKGTVQQASRKVFWILQIGHCLCRMSIPEAAYKQTTGCESLLWKCNVAFIEL